MFDTFRTIVITSVIAAFFGFTDYGNHMIDMVRGNRGNLENLHVLENIHIPENINVLENVHVKEKIELVKDFTKDFTNEYVTEYVNECVNLITPPKTHGYTNADSMIVFIVAFFALTVFCKILNMFAKRRYRAVYAEHYIKMCVWNFVSIIVTTIVASYGVMMTHNIFSVFSHEIWTVFNTCGISGFFFNCPIRLIDHYVPLRDMTPVTQQMINGMDYVEYSSQTIFMTLLLTAYFTYDIIFNRPSIEYIFHHIFSIICIGIYAYTETMTFYVVAGMITELSTGILSSMVFLRKQSRVKVFTMIEFALTFFVCRILLISAVILMAWFNEKDFNLAVIVTTYGIFGVLNLYWFNLIVRKVIRLRRELLEQTH